MTKKNNVEISPRHTPSLQPWVKLRPELKRREIVRFAHEHRGRAVSLNLSPPFAAYLFGNGKPMRNVGKRMHAELKKLDLNRLPILLVLEATKDGKRPHLHGVFIPNGVHDRTIQIAMRKAVGFVPGKSGSRQFHAKFLFNPDGWSNYLKKHTRFTRKLMSLADDQSLWWTSHSMTQAVRDNYEAVRLGKHAPANTSLPPASHAVSPSGRS
jgi:hypothetical protein